ncbi:hypothetical protein PAF17_15830 [Paracoccus sp. Z330]|uniref:Uncharacterized protein n=1 Tax=Paracoccus onchidii TaxID=3017813 RepID=A0ABT4ZHX7_9RHOB|nr:hypothetical protein [Paracoccus onchidii]MDB6178961.1 hypothetical protein [Paracoccus onchidii]
MMAAKMRYPASELSKAERLARALDQVQSGTRPFNMQLAAQIKHELRRLDGLGTKLEMAVAERDAARAEIAVMEAAMSQPEYEAAQAGTFAQGIEAAMQTCSVGPVPEHQTEFSAGVRHAKIATREAIRALSPTPQADPVREAADMFDNADWFWRTMDPDDCGDSPDEAMNRAMVGQYCVCEIASSYTGPVRHGFIAPVLDPESDDDEFLHFATRQEAIDAAKDRRALAQKGE